jgi:NADPH2:quinone reductase
MRAILCDRFVGIGALRIGETAEPTPADGVVLIDVHAACAGYMDCLMAAGGYQLRPTLPYAPGRDAAGIVVALSDKVTRFRPGDRVA